MNPVSLLTFLTSIHVTTKYFFSAKEYVKQSLQNGMVLLILKYSVIYPYDYEVEVIITQYPCTLKQ